MVFMPKLFSLAIADFASGRSWSWRAIIPMALLSFNTTTAVLPFVSSSSILVLVSASKLVISAA